MVLQVSLRPTINGGSRFRPTERREFKLRACLGVLEGIWNAGDLGATRPSPPVTRGSMVGPEHDGILA